MSDNEKGRSMDDDFWNLDEYIKKKPSPSQKKEFSKSATDAVVIESVENNSVSSSSRIMDSSKFSDVSLTKKQNNADSTITRFIPPHTGLDNSKKYVLFEYASENPLIKSVRICSDKPQEKIFVDSNLFIRERRAILNRNAVECPYTAYYSYSPRYSQMSRAQLNYYLWWRENTRNGIFLKADESYIILYAYELAATGEDEDKQAALSMLCSLLENYTDKDINPVYRLMIRDIICDFCLVHALPSPMDRLKKFNRQLLANSYLPEFFVDLSDKNRSASLEVVIPAISMYDYRRSRYYNEANANLFKNAMNGAVAAIFADEASFKTITSFTDGLYGFVTAERRPFARMVNIVNKSVRLEITYYQLSNVQPYVTDAMRYSENKIREHLGIKNKLHIMAINPHIKSAVDAFFKQNYPPQPVVDKRRKNVVLTETEVHEYDRLYDVPKNEFSPQHALEIERDSWETTKILTEAFSDDNSGSSVKIEKHPDTALSSHDHAITTTSKQVDENKPISYVKPATDGFWGELQGILGEVAEFINLCRTANAIEQRKFAALHSLSVDEIADTVNECSVNIFGDIILEDTDSGYVIIEDYIDQI